MSRTTSGFPIACFALAGLLLAGCGGSSDSDGGDPYVLAALMGLEVSPSSLEFGDVLSGSSLALDVTIRNATAEELDLTAIDFDPATSGAFAILSGVDSVNLAPGASVQIRVEYNPSKTGEDAGRLRISGSDGRRTGVPLRGRGRPVAAPEIDVTPLALAFGDVQVGRSSNLNLTIRNLGSAPLSVASVSRGGAQAASFALAPEGWAGSVAPGASQVIAVSFAPQALGAHAASIAIRSDDADEPLVTASLSGNGVPVPVPEIEVSPLYLDFGEVALGSSRALTITVRNTGTGWLNVSSLALGPGSTAEFRLDDTPSKASVAPSASLRATVLYVPADLGADSRTVAIESDDADEPLVVVSLAGVGAPAPVPEIEASPASLGFGEVQRGGSRDLVLTIRNLGTASLNVSSIALASGTTNQFSIASGPSSANVGPLASISVTIRYAPRDLGYDTGAVRIRSNDADEPTVTVSLTGSGIDIPAPEIDVAPLSLSFGNVIAGESKTLSFTIRNLGSAALSVSRVALGAGTSAEFSIVSGSSPAEIPAGGSASVSVAFAPEAAASRSGTVLVDTDDADEARVTVSLSATGIPAPVPEIDVSPLSLGFGDVTVGTSKAMSLTIRNAGTANLSISSIAIDPASSPAFSKTSGPSSVGLAPGASASVQVTYVPPAEGSDQGTLVILSNDADESEISVPLTGRAVPPAQGTRAVTLAWDPPTTNEDGSPLDDLAGFKLYYGTASYTYSIVLDVGNATEHSLYLAPGRYYFAATAYDLSGNESDFSLELEVPLD
ncbi:MAG: choice-of-anchor D domain-containing protein [Planctomycetota bacterium]